MTLAELQQRLRAFAREREWEQFHSPKNLAMALSGEAGELLALFQWLSETESAAVMADPHRAAQVRDELADVFGYLLRLADVLDVDLAAALADKLDVNERRYPADAARGNATKYTELPRPE